VSGASGRAEVRPHHDRSWEWLRLPGDAGFGDMTVSALVSAGGDGHDNDSPRRQNEGGPHIPSDQSQAGSGPRGAPMKTVVVHQSVEVV